MLSSLAYFQAKPKLPFQWPGTLNLAHLNPIPHRYRAARRRKAAKQKDNAGPAGITSLQTSLNPLDTLRAIRRHKWRLLDVQYALLAALYFFSLSITPSAPVIKTLATSATLAVLLVPATRQFFLPSLPIWLYLLYFFSSRYIPTSYRPHIWVRVLPALENVMYGANLSNILSAHTHPVLDLIAWLPYGIGHFAMPAVCSLAMFVFAAPGTTPVFARSFGWLGVLGVTIQLVFPCTPPWYENEHGLAPAAYGMSGSPAGLARIDQIFGIDMYTTSFTTAPVPFGAFPSLHSANAVLEALFMSYCFPRFRLYFIAYVGWILWATMYLSHHYAVDLVGGALISAVIFYIARARYLPQPQPGKTSRWQYEYVDIGERKKAYDEEYGEIFGLGLLQQRKSDEWAVGSTSSYSSSSSSGILSPTLSDDQHSAFMVEATPHGHIWESGIPPRDSEVGDVMIVR